MIVRLGHNTGDLGLKKFKLSLSPQRSSRHIEEHQAVLLSCTGYIFVGFLKLVRKLRLSSSTR